VDSGCTLQTDQEVAGTAPMGRGFTAPAMVVIDEASRVPDELYLAMRPMLHSGDGDLSQAAHAKAYVQSRRIL
jgi:hypothetical protein